MWKPFVWCWFSFFAPVIIIIFEFILAIESVLKFKHRYRSWNPHRKWKQQLARWTQIADLQKCVTKKKLMNQKKLRLCQKIEYFGISVPFLYYSLLGRVIQGDREQLYFIISLGQAFKNSKMAKPNHFCWGYIWTFWCFDVSLWPGEKILAF